MDLKASGIFCLALMTKSNFNIFMLEKPQNKGFNITNSITLMQLRNEF
jgi:hypothetical protein